MENKVKTEAAVENQNTEKKYGDTLRAKTHAKKAKMVSQKMSFKGLLKSAGTAILEWLDQLPRRVAFGITSGIVTAIVLNIITQYFWPELPQSIPTIYEFFNGFLTVGEYFMKALFGGIASIFKGTFFSEYIPANVAEIGEMWSAFCNWISSISF